MMNTPAITMRTPFPAHQISKLPKPYKKDSPKGKCAECGGYHGLPAVHLDYVGHAALTDRLLDVDPAWTWEPLALDTSGLPMIDGNGGLWIRLTVLGVTRLGYGDAQGKTGGDAMKERIGDALRNAAMRFGAALDLWHKGDLHLEEESSSDAPSVARNPQSAIRNTAPAGYAEFEAKHLPLLEVAAASGEATLHKAFSALPRGSHKQQLWSVHSDALKSRAAAIEAMEVDDGTAD